MEMKRYNGFWRGAIILTLAGLVMKILSAFYRIPYQNIAGDIGFYIYQQVYPVYGVCLVLATYGFPVVISKLVAARVEQGDRKGAHETVFVSFVFLTAVGLALFVLLFFGARSFAVLMGDGSLDKLFQVVALFFLLMPFLSIARGYFQGLGDMTPTAVSQVIEQAVRVSIIVLLSTLLVKAGVDMYTVGAGAMFGSIVGGGIGILTLLYFWRHDIQNIFMQKWSAIPGKSLIIKLVFWQGITICVSHLMLILIQLIDSLSLYNLLVETGETETKAKIIKGIYDRGIPLIQLGTVAATTFSLPLIPLITGARARGDSYFIQQKAKLAIKITLVIGLAATAGLICIIRPTNIMLFQNSAGSDFLAVLTISILFNALSLTTASILQGLGNTTMPAFFAIIGAGIKYAGNMLLVPQMGTKGAAVATVLALCSIAALNSMLLLRMLGKRLLDWQALRRIVVACAAMIICVTVYIYMFEHISSAIHEHRGMASVEALTAVTVGGIVYLFFIFKLHVFTEEEVGVVWKREKLQLVFKRMKRSER